MKRGSRWLVGVLMLALGPSLASLASHAQSPIFERRELCELLGSPLRFSGHFVSIRAEVADMRELLLADVVNPSCGQIAVDYPESPDVKSKPGFPMIRDRSFDTLQRGVSVLQPTKSGARGKVVATFEGRFDWTPLGSGRVELRDTRLVLHRVRDVDVTPAR